jgi:hypothetical protein
VNRREEQMKEMSEGQSGGMSSRYVRNVGLKGDQKMQEREKPKPKQGQFSFHQHTRKTRPTKTSQQARQASRRRRSLLVQMC